MPLFTYTHPTTGKMETEAPSLEKATRNFRHKSNGKFIEKDFIKQKEDPPSVPVVPAPVLKPNKQAERQIADIEKKGPVFPGMENKNEIRYYILETAIEPPTQYIKSNLLQLSGPMTSSWVTPEQKLNLLSNVLNKHRVSLKDINTLNNAEEDILTQALKMAAPSMKAYPGYFGFLGGYTDNELKLGPGFKIEMIYNPEDLFLKLNSLKDKESYKKLINSFMSQLDHEVIHKKQLRKMGVSLAVKLNSSLKPSGNPMLDYYTHPIEIPAFAKTMVSELVNEGMSKQEILDYLRKGHTVITFTPEELEEMKNRMGSELEKEMENNGGDITNSKTMQQFIVDITKKLFKKNPNIKSTVFLNYLMTVKMAKPREYNKFLSSAAQYASNLFQRID